MSVLSQFLGVYSLCNLLHGQWSQGSSESKHLAALSLPTSARTDTFSKHLNSHSHVLFLLPHHSPEHFLHFFARLSLRLAHNLYTLYSSTLISGFTHKTFFYIFLAAQYRLVQDLDSTSRSCYSPFHIQDLVTSPCQHAFQSHLHFSFGVAGLIVRSCSGTI